MANRSVQLNSVFQALSDPTRRAVIEKLAAGPASVSVLAEPFAISLPSFLQHLQALEETGLVRSKKSGRVRTFELVPKRLQSAEEWLARQCARIVS